MRDTTPRDIRFGTFWYNQIAGIYQWASPDWVYETQIRIARSEVIERKNDWVIYWDHYPTFEGSSGCYLFVRDATGEMTTESMFEEYVNVI